MAHYARLHFGVVRIIHQLSSIITRLMVTESLALARNRCGVVIRVIRFNNDSLTIFHPIMAGETQTDLSQETRIFWETQLQKMAVYNRSVESHKVVPV